MPFSQAVKDAAFMRAGGRCECRRAACGHFGRCSTTPIIHLWEAHHIIAEHAGGSDTLANCEVLCIPCHLNTRSYGRP